jgi:hypothetical protein
MTMVKSLHITKVSDPYEFVYLLPLGLAWSVVCQSMAIQQQARNRGREGLVPGFSSIFWKVGRFIRVVSYLRRDRE